MSGRRFALVAALCLFVIFVAVNLIANTWFRSARLDLTENQLYSLSQGTRQVLSPSELTEPIQLTFFYSRDAAAASPVLQTYAARVREMLQTYVAASRGRVRFTEVDPKPFSEEEDKASEAGIEPLTLRQGGDPIYFGLAGANAIDDRRAIPVFDIAREPFLEYEITRLIYELQNPSQMKVALITSLLIDPGAGDSREGTSVFATELGRFAEVERLPADFTEIPDDAGVLVVIHPGPLTPAQTYAIDQYILRNGRAFIAVDPASMAALQYGGINPFDPTMASGTASSLPALFAAWGVSMTPEVVLDLRNALPVQTQGPQGQPTQAPQPLFFRVDPDRMPRDDLMTAPLQRGINFGLAGGLSVSERPDVTATPLARTSGDTMRLPAEQALARPTPFDIMQRWASSSRVETVALRLSGHLPSAFANGPPPDAAPRATSEGALARSAVPAEIVIVADTDFLADDFYVDPQRGTFADNGAFALNAIDILGGSQELVGLRARAPSLRNMEVLDRMEADAQRRIERSQQELQAELAQTEERLRELRTRGHGSGFFTGDPGAELNSEERREIDRFTAHLSAVRAELRNVGRNLRADIDRLQALVLFLNVWLAPLLVAGAGLYVFWRRARRPRAADGRRA